MEKTYMRITNCRVAFIISISVNLISVILSTIYMIKNKDIVMSIILFFMINVFSLIGWVAYYIEKRGKVVVSDESITFYYTVFTKPSVTFTYNFSKGYNVNFADVKTYKVIFSKGDGLISADTTFYIFVLNDDREVQFTLFNFGKKQELEIKNRLHKILYKKIQYGY